MFGFSVKAHDRLDPVGRRVASTGLTQAPLAKRLRHRVLSAEIVGSNPAWRTKLAGF
jgi:hypothetical protein